jgi:hypothetical protein
MQERVTLDDLNTIAALNVMSAVPGFRNDPEGFVRYVFPWGVKGSPLENEAPDTWQLEVMRHIGKQLTERKTDANGFREAIQVAVASGHGVGKTALVAWLIMWYVATRPNPAVVVTANTLNQLSGKTWRELNKWHSLSIIKEWFEWTKTQYRLKEEPETWFAQAVPWSEHNSEAFAGTHEKHVLVIFDEASAVADVIWEVVEGALTGEEAIWICFGNPTRNTGRFRECFRKFIKRWFTLHVDSRTARKTNKIKLKQWLEDWGEDSDFFRVRVRGLFPQQSASQLITEELVEKAMSRDAAGWEWEPIIIGVDVAGMGDDKTAICVRQGRKVHELSYYQQLDTVAIAEEVMRVIDHYRRDHAEPFVMIDVTGGLGAGPFDMLKRLRRSHTFPVDFGSSARDKSRYFNKRAEMWFRIRDWLPHGQLPRDAELMEDLTNIEFWQVGESRQRLEPKDLLKERIGRSPDAGDALAITFAYEVRSVPASVQQAATPAGIKVQPGFSASRQIERKSPLRTVSKYMKG